MKTFIIAEAGVNHNGSLELAIKLIDAAVNAGADAVKFQTFKTEELVTETAPKAEYQIRNIGMGKSQFEMLKQLELSYDCFEKLFDYCAKREIMFMSTAFDNSSVDFLDKLGMLFFKVPSGEITNKQLLQNIANKNKSIILSTGMSYLGEVEKAIMWINEIWDGFTGKPGLTLLHCVSNYPSDIADSNLSVMETMRNAFGLPVGYSDHTLGIEISIAAVALGARVIEKHFTLDRNMKGPDHKASLEPDELKTMVKAIRNVEKAMGDGIKKPRKSEEEIRNIARRSLVATKNIKKGEGFTKENVTAKRPATGICPSEWNKVIGKNAVRDFSEDELIEI